MAQLYYTPISINSGQVPSTQTDFPVLVSQTDNRFKTTGNGGHVANSSGFDIRPYSDSGLTTALSYELERYNASTGEVIMWVKVASLSSSTTPIYLGYGDTTLTTDGSSGSNTFSNSFLGVYHLADGSTLNVNSATGSNNGTNHSASATTGQIDGGAAFVSASSQYIDLSTGMHPADVTLSAWVKGTSFPAAYNAIITRLNVGGAERWDFYVKSNGKMAYFIASGGASVTLDGTGTTTLSTGTWYYVAMVANHGGGAGLVGYVNGSQDNTNSPAGGISLSNTAIQTDIGRSNQSGLYWNGTLDECRIASVARSANWIATEYNNQSAPGTFETLGTESAVGGATTGNFFLLFP